MASGAGALLLVIGGGAAGIAALTRDDKPAPRVVTAVGRPAPSSAADGAGPAANAEGDGTGTAGGAGPVAGAPPMNAATGPADAAAAAAAAGGVPGGVPVPAGAGTRQGEGPADRTSPRQTRDNSGRPLPPTAPQAATVPPAQQEPGTTTPAGPVVTTRSETETRAIPFRTRLVRDPAQPRGTRTVQAEGVAGEETRHYLVTLTDGRPTDRRLVDTSVTRAPQHRVIVFGTARGQGAGQGDSPGQWQGNGGSGRDRECRRTLRICLPLTRTEICPNPVPGPDADPQREEDLILLGNTDILLDVATVEAMCGAPKDEPGTPEMASRAG